MTDHRLYRAIGLIQGLFGICAVLAAAGVLIDYMGLFGNKPAYLTMAAGALLLVYGADRATDNRKAGKPLAESWLLIIPGLTLAPLGWWQARAALDDRAYYMASAAFLLVLIYFFLIVRPAKSRYKFLREILAASVFAWVLVAIPNRDASDMPMLSLLFAGTCLSNLLVFSRLDYDQDRRLGMQGLLHAPWFHGDMRALLRAAFVWTLFLPPLLAFYLLAPDGMTQNAIYRIGGLYLVVVMAHWILAEVREGVKGAVLFRLLADALLLCWLSL